MLSACFSCWEITLGGWQRMYSHSFCRRPRDSAILCLLVSCVCLAECNSAEWMADAEVSLVFLTGNGSFSDGEFSVSVCILKLSSFFLLLLFLVNVEILVTVLHVIFPISVSIWDSSLSASDPVTIIMLCRAVLCVSVVLFSSQLLYERDLQRFQEQGLLQTVAKRGLQLAQTHLCISHRVMHHTLHQHFT